MPSITISVGEKELNVLKKRAKKNLFTIKEQVEDIIRRSCINAMKKKSSNDKVDDRLVGIFSKHQSGRKPLKKKKK